MFNNLKIGPRLGLGFAIIIAAGLAMALLGRTELSSVSAELKVLTDDRMVKVDQLNQVKENVNIVARAVRNIALLTDEKGMAAEKVRIDEARGNTGDLLTKLDSSLATEKGRSLLKVVKEARTSYNTTVDKAVQLGLANKNDEARDVLMREVRPVQAVFFKGLDDLVAFQRDVMTTSAKETGEASARAGWIMLLIACLAGAIGGLIAWVLVRSITRPISQAVKLAETVASGDLTSRIEAQGKDETAQLLQALSRMNDNLARIVGQVRTSSDSIATGSAQIATGNQDLSQRTEEQASNLQQTAASMEQIAGTVRNSAEIAGQANLLASGASAAAVKGGEMVGHVVVTMQDIATSSKKIADIIGVIDGIAFQTNILALNAAVEAARAGEQGRGFAVVASEVRNLAGRSAEAAKEIKSLISSSVEKVEAGTRQVNDAGASMGEIVSQVQRVSQMISELSGASVEQSTGVGQIGDAVAQLDQVTQQNAALVEESAAAAESLKQQAARLAEVVSVFNVDGHQAMVTTAPVAANAATAKLQSLSRAPNGARPGFKAATKSAPAKGKAAVAAAKSSMDDWSSF